MATARRTQDAPPRPVCGPWTGALDGLRGQRTHGRRPAANRLRCPHRLKPTPSQQSATLAPSMPCRGSAAVVLAFIWTNARVAASGLNLCRCPALAGRGTGRAALHAGFLQMLHLSCLVLRSRSQLLKMSCLRVRAHARTSAFSLCAITPKTKWTTSLKRGKNTFISK